MRILGSVGSIETKMSFSSWSSCLPFPRAGLMGKCHSAWLREEVRVHTFLVLWVGGHGARAGC